MGKKKNKLTLSEYKNVLDLLNGDEDTFLIGKIILEKYIKNSRDRVYKKKVKLLLSQKRRALKSVKYSSGYEFHIRSRTGVFV